MFLRVFIVFVHFFMRNFIDILRSLGFCWVLYRLWYGVKAKLGFLRLRAPRREWEDKPPGAYLGGTETAGDAVNWTARGAVRFFFDAVTPGPVPSVWDGVRPPDVRADKIIDGIFFWYRQQGCRAGMPPEWFIDPFRGSTVPQHEHWDRVPESNGYDIKNIWDLSRFGFVYTLVRAFQRTGNDKYAGAFWRLVEDWRQKNPPNHGPNWKCGQEVAFRVMAWCFGLAGFAGSAETTPGRAAQLVHMIAVSGERIDTNIGYALSQNNNHGISEAAGLFTIGVLFPEFKKAARWRRKGRRLLEKLALRLFYRDGTFAQHAMVYQRLALHVYIWAIRLGELNGTGFSQKVRHRLLTAVDFLYHMVDPYTGRVPNYGHNDGSCVLPLDNCDYADFRPVLQAGYYLFTGTRVFPEGPWDEDLWWLFGEKAGTAPHRPRPQKNLAAQTGGYYTLHAGRSMLFFRCGGYRHRPHQADMLHVDIRWKGVNIALDPGTFSYHAPAPWHNALTGTRWHNTVNVDGRDQMERVGTFLFLPWIRARVAGHRQTPVISYRLVLKSWARLKPRVRHERMIVQLPGEAWVVLDRLECRSRRKYVLHWLLQEVLYRQHKNILTLQTVSGPYFIGLAAPGENPQLTHCRADADSPRGWWSPNYNVKKPALSIELLVEASQVLFASVFSPLEFYLGTEKDRIDIKTQKWHADIRMDAGCAKVVLQHKKGDKN